MKVAYLSTFDPLQSSSWSGSSYFLAKALREHQSISLEFIGPLLEKTSSLFQIKRRLYGLFGKNYLSTVDPIVLEEYARQSAARLAQSNVDCILSLSALPIAHLESKIPIIYFWDCTFQGNLEYPWFNNLAYESIKFGHRMEQLALTKCTRAVFSSEWAVRTAVEGYNVAPSKLQVVPLGANLDCNRTLDDISRILKVRARDHCKLLFLGVDWVRKGGDVAYKVAKQLNARGLQTTLTIVGCNPEVDETLPPFVRTLGFINKFENDNHRIIEKLLSESHFLIVPSIAESFGAVFCEASSLGTPSLSRKIGGIPTAVNEGINGKLFSANAEITEYCDYILSLFHDYGKYEALAVTSFQEYQTRLNWTRTAQALIKLFLELKRA